MSIEQAIMFAKQVRDGCTSGKFSEWPQLRRSCGELVAEIARLRQELEGGEVRQLLCLAKIRGAVGDDEGRLMGDELVKRIARLESDKSNLENMYKQQAADYKARIAGLEAEIARLRSERDELREAVQAWAVLVDRSLLLGHATSIELIKQVNAARKEMVRLAKKGAGDGD